MKLLSLGNFDKKIFFCLLTYLLLSLIITLIYRIYLSKEENIRINISLSILSEFFFNIFFIIPDLIIRKNKNKEETNGISFNTINYIFNNPYKINYKGIQYLFISFIILLIYFYGTDIYITIYKEPSAILKNDANKSLKIIYLFILSKLIDKSNFYKHQYLSLVIIALMGIIRFIMNALELNYEFKFPDFLLPLFFLFLFPFIESSIFFIIKHYMENKYYTPFFICFIMGIIISVISFIMFLIFTNIACGQSRVCEILSQKTIISENIAYVILIIESIINSLLLFIEILTINHFTIFHLMLLHGIINLILNIINFQNKNYYQQIIIIITFIIEIFAILVFVEMIILNFCGLNFNIKNNIIFRAEDEINKLGKISDYDESAIREESLTNVMGNTDVDDNEENNNFTNS